MSTLEMEVEQKVRAALTGPAAVRREVHDAFLRSLATELAMEILPAGDVLKAHGLTMTQFEDVARTPLFQRYMSEAQIAWGSTSSTSLRIRAKMESMVEQALPNLYKELLSEGITGPKVELIKAMMKGGGIGEQAKDAPTGGVTINISMDATREVKAAPVITIDHNADDM